MHIWLQLWGEVDVGYKYIALISIPTYTKYKLCYSGIMVNTIQFIVAP
jgi:hypothetical protein